MDCLDQHFSEYTFRELHMPYLCVSLGVVKGTPAARRSILCQVLVSALPWWRGTSFLAIVTSELQGQLISGTVRDRA